MLAVRFSLPCPLCTDGTFLFEWPSTGFRSRGTCPACNGKRRVEMPLSLMQRTREVNPPCWGEFGYKKQYRCDRCDHTFTERELIEANRNHRGDTDHCPNCSVLEDWSENEEVKARVIRRWSIKPSRKMESAA